MKPGGHVRGLPYVLLIIISLLLGIFDLLLALREKRRGALPCAPERCLQPGGHVRGLPYVLLKIILLLLGIFDLL